MNIKMCYNTRQINYNTWFDRVNKCCRDEGGV